MNAASEICHRNGTILPFKRNKFAIGKQIAFAAEYNLYIVLFGGFFGLRERVHNAMIGYCNCRMPPFCGKLNNFVQIRRCIHCGHSCVKVQLNTLFGRCISSAFDGITVYIVRKNTVITGIIIVPEPAAHHQCRALLLCFFKQL